MCPYLKEGDRLGVQPPVMPLLHGSFIGVVDEPAFLEDL